MIKSREYVTRYPRPQCQTSTLINTARHWIQSHLTACCQPKYWKYLLAGKGCFT